ncbi:MAG: hypothetical protein AAGA30_00105 [Planctomycetota bacterium]
MNKTSRYFPRNGYTMLEMIIVVGAFSLVFVVNAKWLHETMKFSSKTKSLARQKRTMDRLDQELRKDIRQCRSMALDGSDTLMLIDDHGRQTTYTIDGEVIKVVKIEQQQVCFQDRYDLGNYALATWDDSELPNWISLIVRRGNPHLQPISNTKTKNDIGPSPEGLPDPESKQRLECQIRTGPNPWS